MAPKRLVRSQVPEELKQDKRLAQACSVLPSNYDFEVAKTIWRIKQAYAKRVALQLPEGLIMYGNVLADICVTFGNASSAFVLGDPTYGACCVDDYTAEALGADLLVHYGHSCLVPVQQTRINCLYVFVTVNFDPCHLAECVRKTLPQNASIAIAGTIQFIHSVHTLKSQLEQEYSIEVPQSHPLSPGEVLGCTAPSLHGRNDAIVFVADGRFHLEAMMIANPDTPVYRYDPSTRKLTHEEYDHAGMRAARRNAIERARCAKSWGIVMGTLGRQGNPAVVDYLKELAHRNGLDVTVLLMAELSPERLARVQGIDAWAQVACPRLSIDWGESFEKPVLTPYEAASAMGATKAFYEGESGDFGQYPMNYYASTEDQPWTSAYVKARPRRSGHQSLESHVQWAQQQQRQQQVSASA